MKIQDLLGKKVYIWGVATEGLAVADFLAKYAPDLKVGIFDAKQEALDKFLAMHPGYKTVLGDNVPEDAEIVIKTPGASIYRPEYLEAAKRGVKFTSLMNIFLAELYAQKNRPIVLAITGTKGKTTTASALAFMLGRLGKRVGLGGNIGLSPLDLLGQDLDYVVLELSNYQIASLEYWPDFVQVVSISPAHLDWHLNYENYKRDKLRLLPHAKRVFLCGYDEYLKTLQLPNAEFYYKTTLPVPPLQILGEHNLINISGTLQMLKYLGFDDAAALAHMPDFKPVEHRLEKVFEKNGYTFINDSIATVAEATMAGIRAFAGKPIAVIVGGQDNKSANFDGLSEFATGNDDVKIIVGLPDTGRFIKSPKLKMVSANMQEAVDTAIAALPDGGVVLLSPASPSFNMYKNYKERGHDFAACAKRHFE